MLPQEEKFQKENQDLSEEMPQQRIQILRWMPIDQQETWKKGIEKM